MTGELRAEGEQVRKLARLSERLARSPDLDTLVSTTLASLAELFGYEHSLLLLLDEHGERLFTIASHGYPSEGVGSEVRVGDGIIGMVADRAEPMRVGNLGRMLAYARTVRRTYEEEGGEVPGREIPLPGLPDAESQVAVPAMVLGQLVGVVVIESAKPGVYGPDDEALLVVVATMVASAIEIDWAHERAEGDAAGAELHAGRAVVAARAECTRVRFFAVDGSTFVDGEYLIKGVAGRILWILLGHYTRDGRVEFTNKEVRLDPSLELPEFRDNLESRLILLKRRLDERGAPVSIEKTGRGRFRLVVEHDLRLDCVEADA